VEKSDCRRTQGSSETLSHRGSRISAKSARATIRKPVPDEPAAATALATSSSRRGADGSGGEATPSAAAVVARETSGADGAATDAQLRHAASGGAAPGDSTFAAAARRTRACGAGVAFGDGKAVAVRGLVRVARGAGAASPSAAAGAVLGKDS
jgi:hypothetical protein